MAFLFNLLKLEQHTNCDPEKLVKVLELYFNKKTIPKNRRTKIKPVANLLGNSYLLNAALLFGDKTTDIGFKAQYIRLAGRRDYYQYKYYDIKYLDLSYYTDINLNAITQNPLLTITDNKIYFKYEEL
jgi:hypothetical protein